MKPHFSDEERELILEALKAAESGAPSGALDSLLAGGAPDGLAFVAALGSGPNRDQSVRVWLGGSATACVAELGSSGPVVNAVVACARAAPAVALFCRCPTGGWRLCLVVGILNADEKRGWRARLEGHVA